MSKDILTLAREAGVENSEYGLNCTPGMYAYNMEIVKRFAEMVRAQENEACALIADEAEPYNAADLIRKRVKK